MTNFIQLAENVCATLASYENTLINMDITASVIPGQLSWTADSLGFNDKPISYTRALSAHDTMAITALENNFAKTLFAFQSPLKAIPGIPEIWRNIMIRTNPGNPDTWDIFLESAGVCPGGQTNVDVLKSSGPTAQFTLLAKKLQLAWDTSKDWTHTREFLIANTQGNTALFPIRDVNAPTLKDAWMADDWTWWRTHAHRNRAHVANNEIVQHHD